MSSAEPPRVLVLWDIDQTLIEARGVGAAVYRRAFAEVVGRPPERLARFAGRTELDLMRETLTVNGVQPTQARVDSLADALTRGFADARTELAAAGRVLPGALATLRRLGGQPRVYQGLLTGNLRAVARIKLDVFGLLGHFDLDAGGYGEDHVDRAELVALAQRRASECGGVTFGNRHTVLVGDTPNDVRAAATAGVRVVAVATGSSTEAELRDAGAPVVLPDLSDPVRAARLIVAAA